MGRGGDARGREGGSRAQLGSKAHTVVGGAGGALFWHAALLSFGVCDGGHVVGRVISAFVVALMHGCVLVVILDRTHRLVHGSEKASVGVGTGDRNVF